MGEQMNDSLTENAVRAAGASPQTITALKVASTAYDRGTLDALLSVHEAIGDMLTERGHRPLNPDADLRAKIEDFVGYLMSEPEDTDHNYARDLRAILDGTYDPRPAADR